MATATASTCQTPTPNSTTTSSPLLNPQGILYRTGERTAAVSSAIMVKLALPARSLSSSGGPPAKQAEGSTATMARPVAVSQAPVVPKGFPVATIRNTTQPKVTSVPTNAAAPTVDISSSQDRDWKIDDIVIKDRKVSLSDSESGSLYALCRSWVRNGLRHETQPNFANGVPLLPRPLPASLVDSRLPETGDGKEENEAFAKEERKSLSGDCSARNLLEWHVKRAKRTRARLQKERLRRIERYKQRLALLLPPP